MDRNYLQTSTWQYLYVQYILSRSSLNLFMYLYNELFFSEELLQDPYLQWSFTATWAIGGNQQHTVPTPRTLEILFY